MLPHDPQVSALVCDNLASMHQLLTDTIAAAQAKGEIKTNAPAQTLADFVQCNIGGLRILAKTRPTAQTLYAIIENVMAVVR
jgi:hypothetical protein